MTQIVVIIAIIAVLLVWSQIKKAPKAKQRQLLNRALLIGGGILLLIGLLSGRLHPLIAAAAAAIPALLRLVSMATTLKGLGGLFQGKQAGGAPRPGQQSSIETRFVQMTLDHDSGVLDGVVVDGQFRGRNLSDLSLEECRALYAECASNDEQSRAVLESYLDRERSGWRGGESHGSSGRKSGPVSTGEMSAAEAAAILGVAVDATRDEVISAFRRLMQKLHPDRGGSDYLAAKVNKAKDTLLG